MMYHNPHPRERQEYFLVNISRQEGMTLSEPLAIVGVNCQLPGIDSDIEDLDALLQVLFSNQSVIKEVPKHRWDANAYYATERKKANKIITKFGGFLAHPEQFDAAFFKISATEAKQMDPQQRLFLEVAIRALNHANIAPSTLNQSLTGVYCGISTNDYSQLKFKEQTTFNAYTAIGINHSAAVGRLCHFLNLKGPSMVVDTACSSSLSALYAATQGLQTGECDTAIVGGVHLGLCPEHWIGLSHANMLSASGQCHSFDSRADGYARSEGCVVVIVKRLEQALKNKDPIYALIKSIALNQDGNDGNLLMAPNGKAQIAMHQLVLERAGLSAHEIDYVEAHGTGTIVGDAVEFQALQTIHQDKHSASHPLVIGAIKSNIGHTLAASGLTALLKVIGAFQHERIPPNQHNTQPAQSINPDSIPAIFPTHPIPYERQSNKVRYAQVSNFGFTGTNAAVILQEPPASHRQTSHIKNTQYSVVLSANSEASLQQSVARYITFIQNTAASLYDICCTLIQNRDHYKYRCALIVQNKAQLLEQLQNNQFTIHKVNPQTETTLIPADAEKITAAFLQGSNVRLDLSKITYCPISLPLYFFDRKPYWHEPAPISTHPPASSPQPISHPLTTASEPIAIIGMSCRFPKANNLEEFLVLLQEGGSGMQDIPLERWDNTQYYDPDPDAPGRLCIKQLGLIDNIQQFDAEFFNISPREAKFMSPQLRIYLETSYHALEEANLSLERIRGSRTGVFVGCGSGEYTRLLDPRGDQLENRNIYFATGNVLNALAGRVAYAFDLQGPIQAIDTACSSSMTAIHNACLSLQSGECDMAFAGGVNVVLTPDTNITLSKARMLSPDSRCKTFSADADGYARSEGCGVLLLKRLQDAIADGNKIHAVIKSSAINSDGKSSGFTVPNGLAQEILIRSALTKANLTPDHIDYIETHGTGTPLADPIEIAALNKIFSAYHSDANPLYISSVKTNIGHCENASGVAGVIKAILSLQTQTLFKHLNFKQLNPEICLEHMVIPQTTIPWKKANQAPRYAGVSSFGFSGANAHLILQEAPSPQTTKRTSQSPQLLVLSAKTKPALSALLKAYYDYLINTKASFDEICYTAAVGRSHFEFRVALQATSPSEAAAMIAKQQYHIHHTVKFQGSLALPATLTELQIAFEKGLVIPWMDFYRSLDTPVTLISLPQYPFDRQIYWPTDPKHPTNRIALEKDWCFQRIWEPKPLLFSTTSPKREPWLVIGATPEIVLLLKKNLPIITTSAQDLTTLPIAGVLFFATTEITVPQPIETAYQIQKNLVASVLSTVKQLAHLIPPPSLTIITQQAVATSEETQVNLMQAPLIGLCNTIALELPQYQIRCIDFDKQITVSQVKNVIQEIQTNNAEHYEHLVAYRNDCRLVPRLTKTNHANHTTQLSTQGRYLITGGTGGLGLVSAETLLAAGARDIILAARHTQKTEINKAVLTLQTKYPTSKIQLRSVDVRSQTSVKALIDELAADGLLKGIIHTAAQVKKAPLLAHQAEDIDTLFAAKVAGAWYLHDCSQNIPLDFFIVYSSIASIFGSNQESIYAAANSFLDALIAERHRLGLVGTAIQWGPWGEVGMAKNRARNDQIRPALISNTQGSAWLSALLNIKKSQTCIISPAYLAFMLDFVPEPRPACYQALQQQLLNEPSEKKPHEQTTWLTSYVNLNPAEQKMHCDALVTNICQQILEVSPNDSLEPELGFFDMGFDSLMIAELAAKLKKALEPAVHIPINIGFNYPSIQQLAQHIHQALHQYTSHDTKPSSNDTPTDQEIAIIGMSAHFPGAPDLDAFASLLNDGLSAIKPIPPERWDNKKYYDPNPDAPGKSYVNHLGLLDNITDFDASFFGISPREARLMDPQQRLFLECSYQALEQANYPPSTLRGSQTGVFAGIGPNEYHSLLVDSGISKDELSAYWLTGNVPNLISGRVAYVFDLKGPSISVDTGCSSSLVAIHYACQSLKNREIDYALAGGVNVLLRPESNVTLCKARALSPDGMCHTFDAHANGYVRAEGCGVIFLKRLSDAIRDKDSILAIIKSSAVNNDGKSAGITVPNGQGQEQVMNQALSKTNLAASDIGYIEAHGTGTPLGDPIEIHSINAVYGNRDSETNPLHISSVKTNIGHLESASGVAGVIKATLSLRHNTLYQHVNFSRLNPHIDLQQAHITLEKTAWQPKHTARYAAVNAFGFSGTNVHLILQEYPIATTPSHKTTELRTEALLLSAKTPASLAQLAQQYQTFLQTTPAAFADICYTAAVGREHYHHRLVVVAKTKVEARQLLQQSNPITPGTCYNTVTLTEAPRLQSLVQQYLTHAPIDWHTYFAPYQTTLSKVTLPYYPFDRKKFWVPTEHKKQTTIQAIHPLLGQMLSLPNHEYLFQQTLEQSQLAYIYQHHIFESVVFPAAAHIEIGLSVGKSIFHSDQVQLTHGSVDKPLFLQNTQLLQIQVKPVANESYCLTTYAMQQNQWQPYCQMMLSHTQEIQPPVDLTNLKNQLSHHLPMPNLSQHLQEKSLSWGEDYRVIQESYFNQDQVLVKIALIKPTDAAQYLIHPLLLDGAIQGLLLLDTEHKNKATYVPYAFKKITTHCHASATLWAHIVLLPTDFPNELCVNIHYYNEQGLAVATIEQLTLRAIKPSTFTAHEHLKIDSYAITWQPLVVPDVLPDNIPPLQVVCSNEHQARRLLGTLPYKHYHCWTDLEPNDHPLVIIYETQQLMALFHYCQTLEKSHQTPLFLVTEQAYAVTQNEPVNPDHTAASAFWRSVANEHHQRPLYLIDTTQSHAIDTLLKLLLCQNGMAREFAIRNTCYVPRLKQIPLPSTWTGPKQPFKPNNSYLIVGGTAALAHPLITYLIERGARQIWLLSRHRHRTIDTQVKLAQSQGVSLQHLCADAANTQQMTEALATIEQTGAPLKGIFHLAAVIHDGLVLNLTDDDMHQVLSAKYQSAQIIDTLTRTYALDFFVLFSSTASILGAKGQANYAAANGFLDGLAHARHQQNLPALSINWGPFNGIGMTKPFTSALQQHGFRLLEPTQMNLLDALLAHPVPQIMLCTLDWDKYHQFYPKGSWSSHLIHQKTTLTTALLATLQQQHHTEQLETLCHTLQDIVRMVLGLETKDPVLPDEDLFAKGMDSLMAIEIRSRLYDLLQCPQISLPIEYFIHKPSIARIAQHTLQALAPHLAQTNATSLSNTPSETTYPLCDFQYLFWVLDSLGGNFNLGMQIRLHGTLNSHLVAQAFAQVIQHHDSFWLTFDNEIPSQQRQRQEKPTSEFFIFEDRCTKSTHQSPLTDQFYSNLNSHIPLTHTPLLRVYLYQTQPQEYELHLIVPHIIVDDKSLEILFSQFKLVYAQLLQYDEKPMLPASDSFLQYVKRHQEQYETALPEKIDFWQRYNQDIRLLRLGNAYHERDAAQQTEFLTHFPLNNDAMQSFIAWHQAQQLNLSSGLIAACQIAFYHICFQENIPIILLHSGREGHAYDTSIGLFSEYKRINLRLTRKHRLKECIEQIEQALLFTAPYQKCPHVIKDLGLQGNRLSLTQTLAFLLQTHRSKNRFKKQNRIHQLVQHHYAKHYQRILAISQSIRFKHRLNQWFGWNLALQKPTGLRVILSITPSIFTNTTTHRQFADITYEFPSHFSCVDRPIGNRTLWIYFSKDQNGQFQLSINGPLTQAAKTLIAKQVNQFLQHHDKAHTMSVEEFTEMT